MTATRLCNSWYRLNLSAFYATNTRIGECPMMIHESIERPPAEIVQGFRNLLSYDRLRAPSRIAWDDSMR